MRKILLIEKTGEKFYAIAKEFRYDCKVREYELKSTGKPISKEVFQYTIVKLENGVEKEIVGYVPIVNEGEVDLYYTLHMKMGTRAPCGVWHDLILLMEKERIKILQTIYKMV